jgi:hypothetical protein
MSDITYTSYIHTLYTASSENGLTNVVKVIGWTLRGEEQGEGGLSFERTGAASLESPDSNSFTPYSDLTEEMVWGWIESSLNDYIPVLKDEIAKAIADQHNPIVAMDLPWANVGISST